MILITIQCLKCWVIVFGDYFKKEAIAWAWEFLTDVLKLDKDRLYVSVFEGSPEENVSFDQEAWDLWKQFVSEDRIIKGNKKDNFWEMGRPRAMWSLF